MKVPRAGVAISEPNGSTRFCSGIYERYADRASTRRNSWATPGLLLLRFRLGRGRLRDRRRIGGRKAVLQRLVEDLLFPFLLLLSLLLIRRLRLIGHDAPPRAARRPCGHEENGRRRAKFRRSNRLSGCRDTRPA